MKITDIREVTVRIDNLGHVSNSVVSFAEQTVSLLAVVSDVIRAGKPVIGYGFGSLGRYGQAGILRERMIPRVMASEPGSLLTPDGNGFDPAQVLARAVRNEKPGGHGDRACAAGGLELAVWDLQAKLRDEPAWATIARAYGHSVEDPRVDVYATGGFYYAAGHAQGLADELQSYRDKGFSAFKIKVGGLPLKDDLRRVDEALTVAGSGSRLAVDVNCRLDFDTAMAYTRALAPYGLRWMEEIGDPLDYELNARVAAAYEGAIATGENLFSCADVKNLLNFGGMRPGRDVFQMDPGLCYGVTEYARMMDLMESKGYSRRQAYPHGGHLLNLHIAVGLRLGGTEALPYDEMWQPFTGFSKDCEVRDGTAAPGDAPGFGLEAKDELRPWLEKLAAA